MRLVILGLGGIGSHLAEPACRLLVYSGCHPERVLLIDGDGYEERNRERQRVLQDGNKATATKAVLGVLFKDLAIDAKAVYLDAANAFILIREGDIVLVGVDNHATRKLVSDHAQTLNDVTVISGGNELTDGNVQIQQRVGGKNLHPPLDFRHPEIEKPADKNPADIGCDVAVKQGLPQLLTVNLTIAAMMLNILTLIVQGRVVPYDEVYFDLLTGNSRAVKNIV